MISIDIWYFVLCDRMCWRGCVPPFWPWATVSSLMTQPIDHHWNHPFWSDRFPSNCIACVPWITCFLNVKRVALLGFLKAVFIRKSPSLSLGFCIKRLPLSSKRLSYNISRFPRWRRKMKEGLKSDPTRVSSHLTPRFGALQQLAHPPTANTESINSSWRHSPS